MAFKNGNIALVHDWFIDKSLGGAEKVTQTLDDYLSKKFSTPDIFSLTENITNSSSNILKIEKLIQVLYKNYLSGEAMFKNIYL